MDAKTYDFTSKDIDARLYNLEKGAGFYRKFVVVIPFDFEDIDKPWFPKALQNLPFKLKEKKMDFYVISDSQKQNFWIRKNGQNLEKQIEKPNDITDWIECKLLESFLKREGLLIAHHNTNNQQNKESFLINT